MDPRMRTVSPTASPAAFEAPPPPLVGAGGAGLGATAFADATVGTAALEAGSADSAAQPPTTCCLQLAASAAVNAGAPPTPLENASESAVWMSAAAKVAFGTVALRRT